MHVLTIDAGSYSVKYISSFVDKRRVTYVEMSEIVVRDYLADHPELNPQDAQINIIQGIMDSAARPDTRIIFQADNELLTTRFLTLPAKSKKKAELMLPFQLEEDIPYALSEIHYAYRMEGQRTQHVALVELVRENTFEEYYARLREKDIIPTVLTTETSVMENYFNQNAIPGAFCVINIGHKTTRAYFFYNSRLLITHVSYFGGEAINEMISQTYKIDHDEAILYKHQNAFLLTESQMAEVEDSQKDFAQAMDQVFSALTIDFSRWKIGLKVNHNLGIGHVFLCGGSANIKNISNYLTEKWDTKVALLESFDKVEIEKVDVNAKNKSKFALANMMAQGFKRKNRFINFLSGRFAQASTSEIPLHSFAFLGMRVAAVTAIAALSLLAERFFIQRDIQAVNARLVSIVKNDELEINPRLRRALSTNPRPVLDSLNRRQRGIRQEITTLQSASQIESLSPLINLSQITNRTGTTMMDFSSQNNEEIKATFSGEKVEQLQALKEELERSTLSDVEATIDEKKLQLTMTGRGK